MPRLKRLPAPCLLAMFVDLNCKSAPYVVVVVVVVIESAAVADVCVAVDVWKLLPSTLPCSPAKPFVCQNCFWSKDVLVSFQ